MKWVAIASSATKLAAQQLKDLEHRKDWISFKTECYNGRMYPAIRMPARGRRT